MAAATITGRVDSVLGNKRHISAIGAIADTNVWATGLKKIDSFQATAALSASGIGGAVSGGTITFATSGSLTGVMLDVIGQ